MSSSVKAVLPSLPMVPRAVVSAMSRAAFSSSTTRRMSPASGSSLRPMISTAVAGSAVFTRLPAAFCRARTRPWVPPTATMSPMRSVPVWTSTVATLPRPFSTFDSTMVPTAGRLGLALRFCRSATSRIISIRSSRPVFCLADTATAITSPPYSSIRTFMSASSCFTRSGLASGLSILLMATIIGTRAARTWSIASLVCGMTPSSAATTMIAMSVTCAPRARMAVNASWPGVSRKTMRLSLCTTSLAPMCWVMPPRSAAATVVLRTASSRLVLPWSTWPMIVTIGARVTRSAASSSVKSTGLPPASPSSPGATISAGPAASAAARSATPRSTVSIPSSPATSDAVSKSIDWLMVAKMPLRISSLMTSAVLTLSASARSLTAIDEGSSTGPFGTDRRRRFRDRGGTGRCDGVVRARTSSWLISTGWHSVTSSWSVPGSTGRAERAA